MADSDQQTPFSEMVPPPAFEILPPDCAVVVVTPVTAVVVTVARTIAVVVKVSSFPYAVSRFVCCIGTYISRVFRG